ncbi:hypothetical protein NL676_005907 [Syzygium grande]|nr:hypothetical protein NL676_005907 [Syzygium grande]
MEVVVPPLRTASLREECLGSNYSSESPLIKLALKMESNVLYGQHVFVNGVSSAIFFEGKEEIEIWRFRKVALKRGGRGSGSWPINFCPTLPPIKLPARFANVPLPLSYPYSQSSCSIDHILAAEELPSAADDETSYQMSYSRRSDYSCSPPPRRRYGRSLSRSRSVSRSRSRSASSDFENPGNNLYVTGLSPRITKRELEKHFASEGKVVDVHLVVDPWTRESRGFGFVTMSTVEEAERCIKYLDRSVLEGRVITVEKARRRRGRTPTPGRYLGLKTVRVRQRTTSYSPRSSPRRTPSYSPYSRSGSPRYSSDRSRGRSYSRHHRRRRSYSPYYDRRRAYSPDYSRRRSYSRSRSPDSRSPVYRRDRSYSPYDSRDYSPDDRYHRRSRYRSISRSVSPGRGRNSRSSYSPRLRRRRYSPSESPKPRRRPRKGYSRSTSRSPRRSSKRSYSSRHGYSRDSYSSGSVSRSHSVGASSRAVSRSNTPSSSSPSA